MHTATLLHPLFLHSPPCPHSPPRPLPLLPIHPQRLVPPHLPATLETLSPGTLLPIMVWSPMLTLLCPSPLLQILGSDFTPGHPPESPPCRACQDQRRCFSFPQIALHLYKNNPHFCPENVFRYLVSFSETRFADTPDIDTGLGAASLFTGKHSHIKALYDKSLEEHRTPRARKELEEKLASFKS